MESALIYAELVSAAESGGVVVAANRRLARYLLYVYEEAQIAAGRSGWQTPVITHWSAWLQSLWQESRLAGGCATQLSLLGEERCTLLWEAIIEGPGQPGLGVPTAQLARMARQSWGLLQEWEVADAPEWDGFELTRDQRAFCGWFRAYRQRLADQGLTDGESLAALLAGDVNAGRLARPPALVFAGFDSWAPARARLRDAWIAAGVPVSEPETSVASSVLSAVAAADVREELELAASWARAAWERQPGASIAVVIHDLSARAADVSRVFRDVLAPDWRCREATDTIPLNISYGRPLAEYPVIAALLRLLRASGGALEFTDLSLLLRSPWLHGGVSEAAERAALELRLRQRCRAEVRLASIVRECRERAPRFADIVAALVEASGAQRRMSANQWSSVFGKLAQSVGWPGDATPDSETWQLLDAWQTLLREFADAGEALGELSRNEALGQLGRMAQQKLFQPEGPRGGIQVMGVLEAAGHVFDAVWVTGMAREIWPPAGRPNALLPVELQRRAEMPDAAAEQSLEYARRVTRRLRSCAGEAVFSWPAQADEQPYSASPLIADIDCGAPPPRFELWNRSGLTATAPEVLAMDPAPALGDDPTVRGGTRVFRSQAVCPAVAFMEQRLGTRELDVPPVGISARERGTVVHDVLEAFYKRYPAREALVTLGEAKIAAVIDDLLADKLARIPGSDEPFLGRLLTIERQQLATRICAFVALDIARPDFVVEECEQSRSVQVGPIQVRVKLDRIDRLSSGGQLVIDYKTGRAERKDWNPQRPVDLQLPLYATRAASNPAAIAFAQISAQGVKLEGVGNGDDPVPGIKTPGSKRDKQSYKPPGDHEVIESWDVLLSVWDELLVNLATEFAAGDFRIDPANPRVARGQYAPLTRIYELELLDDAGDSE